MTDLAEDTRLLQMSPAGGCGCKLPLEQMRQFMSAIEPLVGHDVSAGGPASGSGDGGEDAALYRAGNGTLLAFTADFGTPVSDDAETWGRIAAQNALSDVYAMGGRPVMALSLMCVPEACGVQLMASITRGAASIVSAAGAVLAGGHTVRSAVPLFGLAVIGEVETDRVMRLRGARAGQLLVLTKPLGTGIVIAGAKAGLAPASLVSEAEDLMSQSNKVAARLAVEHGVRVATDVTGFGLLGHLQNILAASECSAQLWRDAVPVLAGAVELLEERGVVPNGAERNLFALEPEVMWARTPYVWRLTLTDPQTSGGLLLAIDEVRARRYVESCLENGISAHVIGVVQAGRAGRIAVRDSPKESAELRGQSV